MNIEEITGLEDELASKAPVNHTHSTSEVDGLVEALAGKAETVHSHSTAQVTGLTTALAGKANVSHTHTPSQVTGLDTLLAGKSNVSHTHLPADVAGLAALLDGKADSIHNHDGTQITGTLVGAALPYANLTGVPESFTPSAHTHLPTDIPELDNLLADKANEIHTHTVSDVTGLDSLLAGKSNLGHAHEVDEITDLEAALEARAPLVHTHDLDEVAGLETLLSGKANLEHTHPTSAIDNLDTLLAGKSDLEHTHTISDIESLEAALAERSAEGHTHEIDEINGLPLALEGKANVVHLHDPANVTGLDTLLAGKAPLAHTHSTADVNGLQDALASKADAVHLHSVNDITGFADAVRVAAPANNDASLLTTGTLDDDRLPDNVVLDGDPRLSDARSPLTHGHANATTSQPGFMSAADKFRLDNLVQSAPVNADWTSTSGLSQILNKPTTFPPESHTHTNATTSVAGFMSAADKGKLDTVAQGAQVNVQSNWLALTGDAYILNKPTLGTAASKNVGTTANDVAAGSHFHDPATIFTGSTNKIPVQFLPALPSGTQIFSSGGLAQLTTDQQSQIVGGVIVILTDGRRLIYSGTGSKTAESSYILLSDATPDWSTIENKPGEATPTVSGFMSAADKAKLNGIAAGAEVNVNADWNAGSGDAQILNKPTLGTASALNAPAAGTNASSNEVVLGNDTRLQAATGTSNGLLSAANFNKLAGLSNYTHPTGDGNRHVPATGTTNNGRFLRAGATAASESWAQIGLVDLAQSGAQVGQIPKWNGTNWAPSADAGGIQGTGVSAIVKLTQAEYAALGNNVSPTTFYIVV